MYLHPYLVYIDMGLSTNSPVVLTAVTSGQSFERSFSVQITQIECDSLSKGPTLTKQGNLSIMS